MSLKRLTRRELYRTSSVGQSSGADRPTHTGPTDAYLARRNTGIPLSSVSNSVESPLTPKPLNSYNEPDFGGKFKFPYQRRATVASMLTTRTNGVAKGRLSPSKNGTQSPSNKGRLSPSKNGTQSPSNKGRLSPSNKGTQSSSNKGRLSPSNGSAKGAQSPCNGSAKGGLSPTTSLRALNPGLSGSLSTVNGRISPGSKERTRHFSSGSSYYSDDPEMSISEDAATSNFFDFDENADDIYLAPPEEHVHKLRMEEKKRRSVRKDSITAQPFTPLNVETIGGAYVEEEGSLTGHSRQGSKLSVLSSIPESGKTGHFKPPPASLALTRITPPDTPTTKDILTRDDKIAQLEREVEELKAARWKAPLIPDTINRILMGQTYCLEWYKNMEQKRALLDAAIDTFDGNCVMTVLLFIRKTLNHQILMKMLKKRPCAMRHYCSFLKQLHAWKELISVYQTLGDYESLGYQKLRECEGISDPDQRVKRLQTCQIMFKTTPALEKDARYVEEYLKLTKKQKQIETTESRGNAKIHVGVMFTPLTTTLLYCSRYHGSAPETHVCSPEALRVMFSISEKQFFQVCLLAFTLCQNWTAVDNLLTTKGVFGIGKKRKSPIGFERVVRTLGNPKLSKRPPEEVLKRYLMEVDELESRLTLATYTQVFDVGIETLKQMRDRERLRNYINQIPISRQADFRGKIRALVDNTQLKWKNH